MCFFMVLYMLNELLEWVLDDPECNKKEILCEYVKEKLVL